MRRRRGDQLYVTLCLMLGMAIASFVPAFALFTESQGLPGNSLQSDALDPPTGLAAIGDTSVSLSWTTTTDTYAAGYRIYRGTASGGPYTEIDQVAPRTTTTFNDSPGNGTFYYVVRAFYQAWESVNSNQVSATVDTSIAVDNTSSTTGTGSSLTWSHTVGSGSDRILVVGVSIRKSAKSVSNLTYGGAGGFTRAGTQTFDGTDHKVEIWYKVAPAVGTANVVVTLSAAEHAVAGAASFVRVHQTSPVGPFVGAGGNSTGPSVNVSSRSDEVVLGAISISGDHGGMTLGANQTQRWSGSTGTTDASELGAGSTETGAATTTISWSAVNANRWAIGALALKPATVAAPAAPSGLTATALSNSEISLGWTDNAGTEDGFKIERSPAGAGSWAQIDIVGAGVTTYLNSGLSASTAYDYRVRAHNTGGNSAYSNTASATTESGAGGVAFGNASSMTGSGASLTWSHTVGSGSNRILVVGVSIRKVASTVSGITYGGVGGFTQAGVQNFDASDGRVEIWHKVAPAVGTANVVVTLSSAEDAVAGAVTFTGVHQSTPMGAFTGAGGNTSAPSVNVTSRSDEIVVGVLSNPGDHGGMTVGAGQTQRWSGSTGTGDGNEFGAGSTETGTDTTTVSWSAVNANKWAIGAVALKPVNVSAPAAPSGLTATALSNSEIRLNWTDNASNEDGFKVERSPAGAGSWSQIDTVGAGVMMYLNSGLSASTAYDYRVRAYNNGGNSSYSNTASATTDSGAGPIAVDTSSSTNGTGASLTWSHTVGSGSNRILMVGVSVRRSARTVSNITYGGAGGFTQAGSQNFDGTDSRVEIWYKVAPPVGTANIVVTLSAAEDAAAGAVSFTGVQQGTPMGAFAGAGGSDASPTLNVNSGGGELVLGVISNPGDHGGLTLGANQTQRWSNSTGTGDGNITGAGSTEAGQATVTMSWSAVNANKWAIGAVSLKPVNNSAPGAPTSLGATAISDSRIDLSWTDNSSNESGFRIERLLAGGGTWNQIDSVGADVTTYQDTGLPELTAYDYRVRAYNGVGDSGYSNVASATTNQGPPRAVDIQAANGGSTAGRPEQGDTITYTFSETMLPSSILAGWDGSSTNVVVRVNENGTNDYVTIRNAADTAQLAMGFGALNTDVATATATFGATGTPSTMVQNGSSITVTLGTLNSGTVVTGSAANMIWLPSTAATDPDSNACQDTTAGESGALDLDL